jgi:hypothetical protein
LNSAVIMSRLGAGGEYSIATHFMHDEVATGATSSIFPAALKVGPA